MPKVTDASINQWLEAVYFATMDKGGYRVHDFKNIPSFIELNVVAKRLEIVVEDIRGHKWKDTEIVPDTEMIKKIQKELIKYKKEKQERKRKLHEEISQRQREIEAFIPRDYRSIPMSEKQQLILERLDKIIYLLMRNDQC